MPIQSIGTSFRSVYTKPAFKSNKNDSEYENPINRGTERNLAILASVGGAGITGVLAGWATTLFDAVKGKKWVPIGVGTAAGLLFLGLTLPSKLYNTKVNAYARQKEMDVFSRQKSAQSNIYEDIDNEIKNEDVSLDDKISHYATVKMADNGSGVMIKGV